MGGIEQIFQRRSSAVLRERHLDLRARGLRLGLRLVLVSDLHARDDWFPRRCIADVVDAVNAVPDVDLVALVGDFVGDDATAIDWSAQEYARLIAPAAATLGNHDHWTDPDRITDALERAGVAVLSNRAVPLAEFVPRHTGDEWLAGIDSCWTPRLRRRRADRRAVAADPDAAFAQVPAGADVVVLGHEPHLATLHQHVLHLAGHTHCGQVRSPVLGDWTARLHMPRYSEPYPCRLYELAVDARPPGGQGHATRRDRRWVYTTAGVGYSTVDFRLFCPPEFVVIDL